MHWMVPATKLDENQLAILATCKKSSAVTDWIQGSAGSGKTVLAVHLAQELLVENDQSRICIASFTHALKDLVITGLNADCRDRIDVSTYHALLSKGVKYDLIILDEVQDIPPDKLALIRLLTNKLVVAGDPEQSIYDNGSGVEEITTVLSPRTHKLMIVYRLTQRMIDIVKKIIPNSTLESASTGRMQDIQVSIAKAETEIDEVSWILEQSMAFAKSGDPTAILLAGHRDIEHFVCQAFEARGIPAPEIPRASGWNGQRSNKADYDALNFLLEEAGIALQYIGNNYGDLTASDYKPLTYLMTYHSAKGLDFDTVFLPRLNESAVFWRDEDIERRLLFVAMTRSRRNLFLTHTSAVPHRYIQAIPKKLLNEMDCNLATSGDTDETEFLF